MTFSKKAMMFGADARIALLIFAVVSLVAGLSMLSAYKETTFKRVFSDAQTIAAGTKLLMNDVSASVFDIINPSATQDEKEKLAFQALLNQNAVIGSYADEWGGPYIRISYNGYIDPTLDTDIRLVRLSNSLATTCGDSNSNPCYIFLAFRGLSLSDSNYLKEISDDYNLYKVSTVLSGSLYDVFIKLLPDYK